MSITTALGSETIAVTGSLTVERGDAFLDGGVLVIPAEIVAADLSGQSLTGPVSVGESATISSPGEIRALQTGPQYPASSFFNVYLEIEVPASPQPTTTLFNTSPLQMAASPVAGWPPSMTKYAATPSPCLALLPVEPLHACITNVTITLEGPVGGISEPPDVDRAPAREARAPGPHGWAAVGVFVAAAALAIAAGRLALRRRAR